jgi:hypothetical protein
MASDQGERSGAGRFFGCLLSAVQGFFAGDGASLLQ